VAKTVKDVIEECKPVFKQLACILKKYKGVFTIERTESEILYTINVDLCLLENLLEQLNSDASQQIPAEISIPAK